MLLRLCIPLLSTMLLLTQLLSADPFDSFPVKSVCSSAPVPMATPENLPSLGVWMLGADGQPCCWLGRPYNGKELREPINIILIDHKAKSADEARERLIQSCSEAGYTIRDGHSIGYHGIIDSIRYPQLPQGRYVAFSDEIFDLGNNHGRMFGPHPFRGAWLFTGAFSRERMDPQHHFEHRYVSFNRARDDLAKHLDRHTEFKIKGRINLGNILIDDPDRTTGDHDGFAILLQTEEGNPRLETEAPARK